MKCGLKVKEESKYLVEPNIEPYPVLNIGIYREELQGTIVTQGLIDTGFDGAVILSRVLSDYILDKVGKPDGFEELDAAGIGIPCDVCLIQIRAGDKWLRVRAHMPRVGDLGTILGRKIVNRLTLCLRGSSGEVFMAYPEKASN